MNITVIAISDGDKQFQSIINDYMKRISTYCTVHTIKPIKHGTDSQIIEKETALLKERLEQFQGYRILLAHTGKSIVSEDFSHHCTSNENVLFVIGGAYGVNESVLMPYIDLKLSFGKQTMPHGLVKVILLEQIWRAWTIKVGKKYHY